MPALRSLVRWTLVALVVLAAFVVVASALMWATVIELARSAFRAGRPRSNVGWRRS